MAWILRRDVRQHLIGHLAYCSGLGPAGMASLRPRLGIMRRPEVMAAPRGMEAAMPSLPVKLTAL